MKTNESAAVILAGFVVCAVGYVVMDVHQIGKRQTDVLTKVLNQQEGRLGRLDSGFEQVAGNLTALSTELHSDINDLAELTQIESPADGGNKRLPVRQIMIRSQIAQAKRPIIFVGDSITEAALLPSSICGHDIVNAGVGGMTAKSYLPIAKQVFETAEASLILVAMGTNDSQTPAPSSPILSPSYIELLDFLSKHTSKIAIAGIPPFDMTGALAKGYFDKASGDRNDAVIRKIAATRKLPFIDLRNDIRGIGMTVDGIHLNAAGYVQWRDDILSHIRSSIGCAEAQARSN